MADKKHARDELSCQLRCPLLLAKRAREANAVRGSETAGDQGGSHGQPAPIDLYLFRSVSAQPDREDVFPVQAMRFRRLYRLPHQLIPRIRVCAHTSGCHMWDPLIRLAAGVFSSTCSVMCSSTRNADPSLLGKSGASTGTRCCTLLIGLDRARHSCRSAQNKYRSYGSALFAQGFFLVPFLAYRADCVYVCPVECCAKTSIIPRRDACSSVSRAHHRGSARF